MPYVITEACINTKDKSCVDVCPVDCIYEGPEMLYIQPDECIDCGACEPECPTTAIFEESELPTKWAVYKDINALVSGAKKPSEVDTGAWPAHLKAQAGSVETWLQEDPALAAEERLKEHLAAARASVASAQAAYDAARTAWLEARGIAYEKIDVTAKGSAFEEMVKLFTVERIEDALLTVQSYPGIGATGVFRPGKTVGTADMVVNVQRGGPSTGQPTKVEQGDLLTAIYGSHGDAPKVVLAVSGIEDCFHSMITARKIAETFNMVVVVLTDASLATSSVIRLLLRRSGGR